MTLVAEGLKWNALCSSAVRAFSVNTPSISETAILPSVAPEPTLCVDEAGYIRLSQMLA